MLGFIDDVFKINRSTTTANSDCNFKPKPKDSRGGSGGRGTGGRRNKTEKRPNHFWIQGHLEINAAWLPYLSAQCGIKTNQKNQTN